MCAFILIFSGCDNGTTSTGGGTPAHTHTWGAWQKNATKHWKECTANDGAKTGEGNHTGNPCTVCGDALEITQTFSYPTVTLPSATLNFQPIDLPAGITYTLNDENGPVSHTNGVVNGSAYGPYTQTTFTQTFHKDGKQIGQQVVKATTNGGASFLVLNDASDAKIQQIPPVTLKYPAEEITVAFVSLAASFPNPTINFSPTTTLPTGVTYILKDNRTPQNSWNSITNGFNGQITASAHYSTSVTVTFTQTFYLNGTEITGTNSKRTVMVNVDDFPSVVFLNSTSDTGSVTLKLR